MKEHNSNARVVKVVGIDPQGNRAMWGVDRN